MKILLVITKAEIGGAQAFILNLARGLKKEGKDVSVAFGDGDYLPFELEKESIPYFRMKYLKRSRNPLDTINFIKELRLIIQENNFNVLHLNSTNTLPGVLAAKFAKKKIKIVFTVHGLSVLDSNYQASKVIKSAFRMYFKLFLKFIDKTVFVSKYNFLEAKENNIIKKGEVIYNGLGLEDGYFLNRESARKELESISNTTFNGNFLIGSIGRLAAQKNYQYIINNWQAIKKIKADAKLLIIGEGSERKRYEKLIRENKLESDIYLAGEKKEASRLLKGLDLFILPSIYEGLSISLIEAVLAQIPALASDVGGNSEVIGNDNCFDLSNGEDLMDKLSKSINIPKDIERFSLNKMVKKYIEVYGG